MYYSAKGECVLLSCLNHAEKFCAGKKEDNPEEALKEFRAIVAQEEEKGDWYVLANVLIQQSRTCIGLGDSKL
jgi:hypothetical protein